MKIGLISDTHGQTEAISRAAKLFQRQSAESIVHTGDVTRPAHLESLLEPGWPVQLAVGNMDPAAKAFQHLTNIYNLTVNKMAGQIKINDSRLGITHGHLDSALRQLRRDDLDCIIHGHTHERRDEHIDGVRMINPGAAKSPQKSCALLDLNTGALDFYSL